MVVCVCVRCSGGCVSTYPLGAGSERDRILYAHNDVTIIPKLEQVIVADE